MAFRPDPGRPRHYNTTRVSATTHNLSKASKRIPVTEERWQELHELKEPGQTWDELLEELVDEHREQQLATMIQEKREEGEFVEVDVDEW